jgi:hypothetical protein
MNEFETEVIACVSCLAPNERSVAFCRNCQSPLGTTSALDPIKTIHAEAFMLQKAVSMRPKPIVVLGVWVLFVPWLLGAAFLAVNELAYGYGFPSFVFFWVGIALAFAAVKICLAGYIFRQARKFFFPSNRSCDCGNSNTASS